MKDDGPFAAAQRHGQSLLQSMIDQSPALVAICAIDHIYLLANTAFAHVLGVSPESLVGCSEDELAPRYEVPGLLRVGGETAETGVATSVIEEAVIDGRSRCFLATRFPIRSADGDVLAVGLIATEIQTPLLGSASVMASLQFAEDANAGLRRALDQMEKLAYTDRLTGAWNRRHLDDAALIEMSRAERHGHAVSLLIVDIDHFKLFNDRFGHPAGDRVLCELVKCIRNGVRRADTITRWGGEEFIVLAPDTPLHEAERLAQKLCTRVAASAVPGVGRITISIGIAEYQCGEGYDAWLLRADRALYQAKVDGRNRCVADPLTGFDEHGTKTVTPSLVQLVWRENYRCGNGMVDRQHRKLFDHANQVLDAVITGARQDVLIRATRGLLNDVAAHFADEERLHVEIGYPDRDDHATEHRRLLEKARRLCEEAARENLAPAELFQFLAYEVVAQHMLGADRRYFPYLDEGGPSPDASPAG